ncbi:enhanced adult sensory threshold isoform 1-T3 [Cochliomyia hominivorax]
MSTRKSTLASPTAQGTKVENASSTSSSTTHNTKLLEKTNASTTTADKAEMGANASSNTNIVNTNDPKLAEQIHKTNQDTKPFQQRVTRNSPLLLGGITIKKEPLDSNEHHTNSESEEGGGSGVHNTGNTKKTNIRGRKSIKEHKELPEKEDKQEELEFKDKVKDKEEIAKEVKEESAEKREHIEQKDKESTTTSPSATTASNRLTRKSLANQEVANTRVTRQRQSSGASARSETPPARGRSSRSIGRGKMPVPMIDPTPTVTKRKRSVDVDNGSGVNKNSNDEPGPKYIKIEVKDPDLDNEELLLCSQTTNASSEGLEEPAIKIKQEIFEESENEMPTATESNAANTNSTVVSTSTGRGKGRNAGRKSTNNTSATSTTNNSPSTRATRQTKQNSPVQSVSAATASSAVENKRRRMGSQTRSLLKTNVGSNAKNLPANGEEEDSKDSTTSSTNTDDIVLALIKSEKISMELDDDNTNEAKELSADIEKIEEVKTTKTKEESGSSDLPSPLIVDTDVAASIGAENSLVVESAAALTPVAASCSSVASGSEKAASLSPSELVSEGVSEISVKQFYKKPKFLENNLGIEEDPKLGNIVQKVAGLETTETNTSTTTSELTTSTIVAERTTVSNKSPDVRILEDSYSNESLKEGTLRFEESIDDKKSISQDDGNSLSSSDNLTPLLIVEDDDDGEPEEESINIKENEHQQTADVDEQKEDSVSNANVLSDVVKKESAKLSVIEVEDEESRRDQDQEDELTLEESETISMDNNASINDEIATEIEDPANEENITEIDDITDLTEVIDHSNDLVETEVINIEDKINIEVNKETKENENPTLLNIENDANISSVAAPTAEDEDNDVLAKIDAELKKIDERNKEKIVTNEENKTEDVIVLNPTEDEAKISLDDFIITSESMDVDSDVKSTVEDTKNITKEDGNIDDVLDIKLYDEQPFVITEDIKLLDDKDKEDVEDVGIGSDNDNLVKEEKADIKNNILKTTSEIDMEALNGKPSPTSSLGNSPNKTSFNLLKDDDATSMKSGQSATSWVTLDLENDDEETLRKKEIHLQNLGLVTHKAAEKRRLEVIQSSAANVEASKVATQHQHNKRNGKNSSHAASTHHEYTGTLKTIIKINRNSTGGSTSGSNGRKTQTNVAGSSATSKEQQQRRQSLKMTFQKGRARAHGTGNNDRSQPDREGHGEDNYYTIQNETEGALQKVHNFPTTSTTSLTRLALTHTNNNNNIVKNLTTTYARKSYNYRYNHHHTHSATSNNSAHIYEMESHDHTTGVSTKKDEKEEILIPEKASSFKFHPGRLCEDQCFYCSGKFGLYDTPCHVGQIKSMERQQKILANEEKLTVDNCLCDACFRHVDRRANVPSYKKRLSAPGNLESLASTSSKSTDQTNFDDQNNETEGGDAFTGNTVSRKCLVPECTHPAVHSLRRKCIRKSVKKFLLKFEIPAGAASVWLCQSHYDTVIQCSGCVLCKRRLGKNHMYHITSDTDRLEKALCEMGIPVQLGIGTAVCKLCRYFANLLMKPPDSTKSQKAEFVKNYRKRLLQFHNIHDGSNDASEADEDDSNSNSASNNDNNEIQQKSLETLQQENNEKSASNQAEAAHNLEDSLVDKSASSVTNIGAESSTTNNLERDCETAGISTDSSNSSSVSNTASNSPNEMSKLKAILQSNASGEKAPSADISNVLRANPNISMRELFPGEEDLGLQFKVPFGGSSSQRTPEGWTRVQTFLQYDEPTRRLWEELQKPYGNQSSFLRHLILLEKYFRNGDLILSASASNNASVYTQTVRQRLTSYDKGHCGGLHMGTGTPKENTSASNSNPKSKEIDPQIPTFVINEDDDEDDSEDQDVEMTEIEKVPKSSATAHKDNSVINVNKQQLQRSRSLSVDKLTKQLSSNSVTITARPKDTSSSSNNKRATPSPQKSLLKDNIVPGSTSTSNTSSSANLAAANAAAAIALAASTASAAVGGPSNSRSILKCNLLGMNKSVEILPISNASSAIIKTSSNPNAPPPPPPPPAPILPVPETKQQKILDVANKLLGNHLEATAAQQNKNQSPLPSSPPELVSLQRRSIGQVMAGPTANANNNQQSNNLIKRPQLLGKPGTSRPPPNVVVLPDTLTPQERLQSKTWRPTLMPVEENQNLLNKNGPLYQTADGRRLPALVQVQSGGKPFLISIFDYNRMCILRREKLMRDQMLKNTKKRQEAKQQQAQAQQQQQQQQQQQHLQNQQQFQKTNFQNMMKNYQNTSTTINQRQQQQQQQTQEQAAHQQFIRQQLLQHQEALLRKAAAAASNSTNSQNPPSYRAIAPKPATSNITTMPPLQAPLNTNVNFTAPMMPLLANAITNAANTGNVNPASTSTSLNNTSWLWNNFPDANQLLLNGGASSGSANAPKLPQLLAKPNNPATTLSNAINVMKQHQQQQQQQHQQQQLLLSKIPKSLTVIPQHKLMNNSASGAASGNNSSNLMKE